MSTPVKVEAVKQGEYVKRKADSKTVYIRNGYDRPSGCYELERADDIGRYIYVKKGTVLHVGFTY